MLNRNILLVDVETTNSLDDPLVYDLGLVVLNKDFEVVESYSLVISDIFNDSVLMDSAYYAEKIPMYLEDLKAKITYKVNFYTARQLVLRLMKDFDIKDVYAYNCAFDKKALTKTYRYLTKSKFRWFFPFGTRFNCIWHIACQTIGTRFDYYDYCIKNGFFSKAGNIRTSAEIMYRFITNDSKFKEEHTGLADCLIEREILIKSLEIAEENGFEVDHKIKYCCWRIPQKNTKRKRGKRARRQEGRE